MRANRADQVRWREWGSAAFDEAQREDKPLMLCITAFWCGFCQRMDETTFSDGDVIALLNAYFIPVRVEESQRPDVDIRYNLNGWPTIAFLTPNGHPLFTVNYTPPEPFAGLLAQLQALYRDHKAELQESEAPGPAAPIRPDIPEPPPLGETTLGQVIGLLEGLADLEHGGFSSGDDNKMLYAEANELFLYLHETTGEASYLAHVEKTLRIMRRSRTYDEKDGGFFRYSSKPDWREPHPEKLLADQAAMLRTYLHAFLVTESTDLRETAQALIRYLDTTLSDPATGAFYGCQDYVRPDETGVIQGPRPLRSVIDTFVYADANAQTASAYLETSWILGDPALRDRALRLVDFLWEQLRSPGRGIHHYSDGAPHVEGLLGDAVSMASALLDAYRLTADSRHLERAKTLASEIVSNHFNPAGGFFDVSSTGPGALAHRLTLLPQNAALADVFLRLAALTTEKDYRRLAEWALRPFTVNHQNYGAFAAGYGQAVGRALAAPLVMTVTGRLPDANSRGLARAAMVQLRHPNLVVRFEPGTGNPEAHFNSVRRTGPFTDPGEITAERVYGAQ